MADEFVEVVNTTITDTELPSNNSTHTLKTAGAAESFALKDIGIKTGSKIAQYSFLLNDFEVLSFGAGESGVASGLDLIPKSGTLKIKGKSIPIDSESILYSTDESGSSKYISMKETVISPEFARASTTADFTNNYDTTTSFGSGYTSGTTWNSYFSYVWQDGDRFRALRRNSYHTSQSRFEYADTAGGSISYIDAYGFEYVPDLNKFFYIDTSAGDVKVSNTDSAISFSTYANPSAIGLTSTLDRLYYAKGWLFIIDNPISNYNISMLAKNVSTGIELYFNGGGNYYTGAADPGYSMGYCINYDPATDKLYFFRTSYATADPIYINRCEFPKTLTQMNAYTANTTISNTFANNTSNAFYRTSTTSGPFAYNYAHFLRGSLSSPNVFYLTDPSVSTKPAYYYDFSSNTLNNLNIGYASIGGHSPHRLLQQRDISTADETQYGGSFSNVDVRVTGIQTT